MNAFIAKVMITAVLVAAISELARRSTLAAALLASLPLTSLLAIVWLYRDSGSALQAAQLASGIFWLVIPSLAFFLVFPLSVKSGAGFWPALSAGILATIACYALLVGADRIFGLELFK